MKIYHGDNFGTTKLDPKKMNMGNNQEGIGIYFASKLSFAEFYGKKLISIDIDPKNFIDSRSTVKKEIPLNKLIKIYLDLWKSDNEAMYYMVTDWGVELSEPEDVTEEHVKALVKTQAGNEVRNLQIELVEAFDVETFVESWNKHLPNIHGTIQNNEGIWCVINTKYKVNKVNW